jgi:hypothetical protein
MSDDAKTTSTATAPKAPATKDAPAPGQEDIDANTAHENAVIAANQERYEKRLAGQSSAEINEEERQDALDENPPEEGLPKGGQTFPETKSKKG